jgi:DNA mismatch repair protein MutS2
MHAPVSLGVDFVEKIAFSNDLRLVQKLIDQTHEFKQLLSSGEPFPSSNFVDIYPYLDKAKVPGTFLYEDEFHQVRLGLHTLNGLREFFEKHQEEYPQLSQLLGMVAQDSTLLRSIEKVMDDKGKIKNNATQELSLNQGAVACMRKAGYERSWTVFTGMPKPRVLLRMMPPSPFGGKDGDPGIGRVQTQDKGFIHDESATGQTVFLEPAEVLDINNEIRDLEYMERREIQKILTQLTDQLRGYIPRFKEILSVFGASGFHPCQGKFAIQTDSRKPQLARQKNCIGKGPGTPFWN